uniref:Uncharacterized protein n=1 Tax=Glossina brevipalpis TaxID=37001 RepID=A0A1A9VZF0_9MUSC
MSNDNELVTNPDGKDRANLIGEQQLAGATAMDTTQQLMAMLRQQKEALASCMYEIGNMKTERRSQMNQNENTHAFQGAASTSTPNNTTTVRVEEHRNCNRQEPRQQQPELHVSNPESSHRRNIDLTQWHIKFDGSGKGLTTESCIFRVEKLQHHVRFELFAEFHCLVTGNANKWYWRMIEDHDGDVTFDCFALKRELLEQCRAADSDFELIREIMERKQQPAETFDEFYDGIHDLGFRMKNKIPEVQLININKLNLTPALATLIFSIKVNNIAALRAECKRAEKFLLVNKQKSGHMKEANFSHNDPDSPKLQPMVEAYENKPTQKITYPYEASKRIAPTPPLAKTTSFHVTDSNATTTFNTITPKSFCQSPFHLTLCFTCGMPGDYYLKNPIEAAKTNRCRCPFHEMKRKLLYVPDVGKRQIDRGNRELCPVEGTPDTTVSTTSLLTPPIIVLQRRTSTSSSQPQPTIPVKSLNQRILDYKNKRREIFAEEVTRRRVSTRKFKILQLRQRSRLYKQFRKNVVSAIVTQGGDTRLFAKNKIDGIEMTALLETGASVSCCGARAQEYLSQRNHKIVNLRNQRVKTANGNETVVTELISLSVAWEGEVKDMKFLIVPGLQQSFYFGIDFWKTFGLTVAAKPGHSENLFVCDSAQS